MIKRLATLLTTCMILACSAAVCEEDDYICAQPGDCGGDVRIVLQTAQELGFLADLDKDQDAYLEEYIPSIQEMEKALSLEADGIIHLSELDALDGIIYPGMSGQKVKRIMERLANLGYINNLPDEHSVYDKQFINSVKNAERKLKLIPDGYLTATEQKVIGEETRIRPDALTNLKAVSKNGKAVLSWSPSKNAARYMITRDGRQIAVVTKTTWTDETVSVDENYYYSVIPDRYIVSGTGEEVKVYIDPVYKQVNIKDLYNHLQSYTGSDAFVKFTTPRSRYATTEWDGDSTYFLFPCSGNYYIYLYCKNYKSWTWKRDTKKPEYSRDKQITVEGKVSGTKYYNGQEVPVIDVKHMHYTYWD